MKVAWHHDPIFGLDSIDQNKIYGDKGIISYLIGQYNAGKRGDSGFH
jgi:hypothetical protein